MIEGLIRREFNRWAAQGRGRGMEKTHWDITRQLIDLMNVQPDDNVADLGCGVGWATRVLAEKASRGIVVGLDLSDVMIKQAIEEYRNPSNSIFVLADAAHIPCPDKMFNSLLSIESIYYYPDLEGAFQEVHRILKPTGKAHFLISYYKENVYSHEWAKYIDIPLQLIGAADYCKLLTTAGFATATHRRIVDTTPIPEPSRWLPTPQDQVKFQAEGALLLSAEK